MTIAVSKLLRFVTNGKNSDVPQLLNSKVDLGSGFESTNRCVVPPDAESGSALTGANLRATLTSEACIGVDDRCGREISTGILQVSVIKGSARSTSYTAIAAVSPGGRMVA